MNIQVFNLSRDTGDADLRRLFSVFGVVNAAEVARDKLNGRSHCRALIEMPIENEARMAIAALDQKLVNGKKISVSEHQLPPSW
jgi:RNA recognition motif-containing protein